MASLALEHLHVSCGPRFCEVFLPSVVHAVDLSIALALLALARRLDLALRGHGTCLSLRARLGSRDRAELV